MEEQHDGAEDLLERGEVRQYKLIRLIRHEEVERGNKGLVRETERLKQSLGGKGLNLDEPALKLAKLKAATEDGEDAWSNQLQVPQEELADQSKERACLQVNSLQADRSKL